MSSPVQFIDYQILRIDYRKNQADMEQPIDGIIPDPEMEVRVNPDNKNEFIVKLISKILPDQDKTEHNCPVELEMEIIGFFELSGEVEEGERDFHLGVSAPSMLYGIMRSWVSQITAHSGFQPIILPSIQFGQSSDAKNDEENPESNLD